MASSSHGNGATVPNWMAIDGDDGSVTYLQLLPKKRGSLLPKNPFIVSKSIQQHCGNIDNAYTEGKGTSMVLKVRGKKQVTALLKLTKLIDGTEIEILEHEAKNQTRGVVSCGRSLDCTDDEILEGMKEQNVIGIRRLNGKERKPSATMILTFRGTVLPKHVFFGYTRASVKTYTPAPMQCFKCYKFGHTKARCEGKQVCRNCSEDHEISLDENNKTICSKSAQCVNCAGSHSPADRRCPKYIEEQEIAKIRSEQDVSFGEARKIHNARHLQTYANSLSGSSVQQRLAIAQNQEPDSVKALRQELAAAKKAIAELSSATRELTEARKALADFEKVKKELAELKKAQQTSDDEAKPTKTNKKTLKKQKRQEERRENDATNPINKKQKPEETPIHIPYVEETPDTDKTPDTEKHNNYDSLKNQHLLDDNLQPLLPERKQRRRNKEKDTRSRSRSRSLSRSQSRHQSQ